VVIGNEKNEKNRLDNVLGHYLLFLAIGVLMAHCGLLSYGMSRAIVSGFFIIRGYLNVLTLSKNYHIKIPGFYWNRFLRIYPMHAFVAYRKKGN